MTIMRQVRTSLLAIMGIAGVSVSCHAGGPTECTLTPDVTSVPSLPVDVCGGLTIPGDPLTYFDTLAWQTFKLLVWPASKTMRGDPDGNRAITDMDGSRVFETYKADWEVFRDNAADPGKWNDFPGRALPCQSQPAFGQGDFVLASFSEFGVIYEASFTGLSNALVARNKTFVGYLAGFNQTEFNTIVKGKLYDPIVVGALPPLGPGQAALADDGAMTVKSAWIELPDDDAPGQHIDPARFYWRKAWVQDHPELGAHTCHLARVALVGLHFVHKTQSRPQWIWASFEHVDNVPDGTPASPPGPSTFNSGSSLGAPESASSPPPEWQFPHAQPVPKNVVRWQQIEDKTRDINTQWEQELSRAGSIWQNYRLVVTQWPSLPGRPNDDAYAVGPAPPCALSPNTATANVVLETFFQQPQLCKPGSITCMTCHNIARNTDFVQSIGMQAHRPSIIGETSSARLQILKGLQQIVSGERQIIKGERRQ